MCTSFGRDVRQEVFRYPRVLFPRDSPFLNDAPATSSPPRKTPSEIYARVQPCNGAQLLATVTGGIRERWFTIIAGTSRYRPLQCLGGLGANAEIFSSYRGLRNALIAKYWPRAATAAAPLRCTKRKCNFLRVRIFTCCATSAAPADIFSHFVPYFFFCFLAYRALLKLLIYFSGDFRRPGDAPRK